MNPDKRGDCFLAPLVAMTLSFEIFLPYKSFFASFAPLREPALPDHRPEKSSSSPKGLTHQNKISPQGLTRFSHLSPLKGIDTQSLILL
jgi:hypothetical protein